MKLHNLDLEGKKLVNEITNEEVFFKKRNFFKSSIVLGTSSFLPKLSKANDKKTQINFSKNSKLSTEEKKTSFSDITTYNNFYEFGTSKSAPAKIAPKLLKTNPWILEVEGLVSKPKKYDLESFLKISKLEERIYRLRCVEGWSMVIPWIGFPLSELIKRSEPLGSAKYLEFVTLADPKIMPEVASRRPVLEWPYREGLRLDEALNPLTMLCTGLYGKQLLAQNGAPIRLVVPWKYGFKSSKSIVKIRFLEKMPITSWVKANSNEYGFFSNVNPNVPHRRWSQATERRIGQGGLFSPKIKTMIFNGYKDWVEHMYRGMDLKKNF